MSGKPTALVAVFALCAGIATTAAADVEPYDVDKAHSRIGFKAYTKLFDVEGRFKRWSAKARFDPADLTKSQVSITVETKSVDTDNDARDDHLRNEDFFHTTKHPRATFVSTKFVQHRADSFEVEGDLTIRGVKKRVKVPFQWTEVERHSKAKGGVKYVSRRARGQLRVNRHDFNINYKAGLLLPSVDKNVDIFFDINFYQPPVAPDAKTADAKKANAQKAPPPKGGW